MPALGGICFERNRSAELQVVPVCRFRQPLQERPLRLLRDSAVAKFTVIRLSETPYLNSDRLLTLHGAWNKGLGTWVSMSNMRFWLWNHGGCNRSMGEWSWVGGAFLYI
ncbi:unnamed protein product [Symbiodinium sp. CCMP2456]|nr:unnamed protein product [Symbiodinium sp. CCMP2456]